MQYAWRSGWAIVLFALGCGSGTGPVLVEDEAKELHDSISDGVAPDVPEDCRADVLAHVDADTEVVQPPCVTSLDCPGDTVCDSASGACVQCVGDADCDAEEACGPDKECHPAALPCDSDKDCKPSGLLCDVDLGMCVECTTDEACAPETFCLDGYCLPDVCTPGAAQCNDESAVECSESGGAWILVEVCSGDKFCEEGACVDLVCLPGEAWCDDAEFKWCSDDGKALLGTTDCEALGQVCTQDGCQDMLCEPGTFKCSGTDVEKCSEDGLSYDMLVDCASQNMSCNQGACSPVCGDGMCSDFEDCLACEADCGSCPACEGCGALEKCGPEPETCVSGMVEIPAGEFWMGCNAFPADSCHVVDVPLHSVLLSAYLIDLTEVTAGQYAHCVDAGICSFVADNECISTPMKTNLGKPGFENHPMNCCQFKHAEAYCGWAGKRLCTEAEWEKAARGGCEFYSSCKLETPPYPWGTQAPTCQKAVYNNCEQSWTAAVGTHPQGASPYGVFDLAGNVKEFTNDWFATDYYCMGKDADVVEADGTDICPSGAVPAPDVGQDPLGPVTGEKKVVRGGAWDDVASGNLRSYRRAALIPAMTGVELGFRCCADP